MQKSFRISKWNTVGNKKCESTTFNTYISSTSWIENLKTTDRRKN